MRGVGVLAQSDPKRFANLLTVRLNDLSSRKHTAERVDKDSGLESFHDAVSVSSSPLWW